MNKRDLWRKRNETLRLTDPGNRFGSHAGCVRINTNNSLVHEIAKLKKVYELKSLGHSVLTEIKLVGGGIADILDLDDCTVYECLFSETLEQAKEKTKKYPSGLYINFIQTVSDDDDPKVKGRKEGDK